MILCPSCKAEALLKGDGFHVCNRCGAQEMETDAGNIWRLSTGQIVAAPTAEKKQLDKAKEDWPSGDWNNI